MFFLSLPDEDLSKFVDRMVIAELATPGAIEEDDEVNQRDFARSGFLEVTGSDGRQYKVTRERYEDAKKRAIEDLERRRPVMPAEMEVD